jgi:hypothetical protein
MRGHDAREYYIGSRVELAASMHGWLVESLSVKESIIGSRYGIVIGTSLTEDSGTRVHVVLENRPACICYGAEDKFRSAERGTNETQ